MVIPFTHINQSDTAHQENKRRKPCDHHNRCSKRYNPIDYADADDLNRVSIHQYITTMKQFRGW